MIMFCCLKSLPGTMQICMGMCLHKGVTEEDKKAKVQSSKIEQDLCEYAKSEMNVVKILLLGPAESGKSTLVKQIKMIHSHGFTKQELISFKPAVVDNLLTSMKFVLQGMGMLRINLANKNNKVHARAVLSCGQCLGEDQELLPFVAHAFCVLWGDQGLRVAAARGYEFDLNDSALYFFENMSRIIAPNYIPTEMDVLRVRVRTCGIIETQFQVEEAVFRLKWPLEELQVLALPSWLHKCNGVLAPWKGAYLFGIGMYDVGGHQSEKIKWLSCFDCVQVILFVVALSGYDITLMEGPSMRRLQESLELFTSVCNKDIFKNTTMILFMNKTDLFREKILYSGRHLRFFLPSYEGADCDVEAAAHHITAMFVACNRRPNKPVFHHFTAATDTSNIQVVFQVVMDQILEDNLAAFSLL